MTNQRKIGIKSSPMVRNAVPTSALGNGILGPGEQHSAEGVTGGRGTAGAADSPFANGLNPSNAAVGNYQNLVAAITNLESAYSRLKSTATPIPWEQYGQQAAGAASGFDKLTESLTGLTGKLDELASRQTLINSLVRLGGAMPSLAGQTSRIMASSPALTKVELVGDAPVKTMLADGWQSRRVVGVGANSHEALQLYKSIQTRMIRAYTSGINTVDPRTLDYRMRQLGKLNQDMNTLQTLVMENRKNEVSGRPMTAEELKIFDINNDDGNFARLQADIHGSIGSLQRRSLKLGTEPKAQKLSSHIGALSARIDEFRDNRDYRTLDDAAKWHKRAVAMLEDDKSSMSNADYVRYRSRLNVYASTLDTLRAEGKIDPKFAVKQIGGALTALNAEMGLLRSGGISEDKVRARLENAQAMMEQYGPWVDNENKVAQLQAGLKARELELAGFNKPSTTNALQSAKILQRNQILMGSVDPAHLDRTKLALKDEIAVQQAILDDDKTSKVAKEGANKQIDKLTTALKGLDSISKSANGAFDSMFTKLSGIAGMAVGIYSIGHAFSRAISQAMEFSDALRKVEAALMRLPNRADRAAMAGSIREGAISDALTYGMDMSQSASLRTTVMMGAHGSIEDRARLGKTVAQLGMIAQDGGQEFLGMISPMTSAGMDAKQINSFLQSSQVLQGSLGLTPDRYRTMLNAMGSGIGGLNALTDFDTLYAAAAAEAASTRDRMMGGSKLNRVQVALRNPKALERIGRILSRGGERQQVGGYNIEEITNSGSPMLTIDRVSQLYKQGELSDAEVGAIAQTMDKRGAPAMMDFLKDGLDEWRGRVREAQGLAESGFVSTDEQSARVAKSMGASVQRINAALGNLVTSGLDPVSRSLRTFADIITGVSKVFGPLANVAASLLTSFAMGVGTSKGIGAITSGIGGWVERMRAAGGALGAGEAGPAVPGSAFWRGVRGTAGGGLLSGGMLGIALGVGTTAWSLYSDHRERKNSELLAPGNDIAAGVTAEAIRTQVGTGNAIALIKEVQEAAEKGTLTAQRKKHLQEQIAKAVEDETKAQNLVTLAIKGQTKELEYQLELLNRRDAGARAGKAAGVMATISGDAAPNWGGTNAKVEEAKVVATGELLNSWKSGTLQPELRAIFDADETKVVKTFDGRVILKKTGRSVGQALLADGLDNHSGTAWQSYLLEWANRMQGSGKEEFIKTLQSYGANIALNSADFERVVTGGYSGLVASQWSGTVHDAQILNAKDPGKAAALINMFDQVFAGKVSLQQALTDEGTAGKDATKILLGKGGALNREGVMNRFRKVFGDKGQIDFIPGLYTQNEGDIGSIARRIAEGGDTMRQKVLAKYGASGMQSVKEVLAMMGLEAKSPEDLKGLDFGHKTGSMPTLASYWKEQYGALSSLAGIGDVEGMGEIKGRLAGGRIWYNGRWMTPAEGKAYDLNNMGIRHSSELHDLVAGSEAYTAAVLRHAREKEQLEFEWRVLNGSIRQQDSIFDDEGMKAHKAISTRLMHGASDRLAFKYGIMLGSDDPYVARQGKLLYDADLLGERFRAETSPEAMAALTPAQREYAARARSIRRVKLLADASKHLLGAREAAADFSVFSKELANPLGLFAGESSQRQRSREILDAQIEIQEKYLDAMKDDYSNLEDRIKATKTLVELERKRVESEEAVVRAKRAAQIGLDAQSQVVDFLTDSSSSGTLNRIQNFKNLGQSLINRGVGDQVRRVLGSMDNPIAKMASFIYDPGGTMDAKYAQERLTNATLHLSGQIEQLNNLLRTRVQLAEGTRRSVISSTSEMVGDNGNIVTGGLIPAVPTLGDLPTNVDLSIKSPKTIAPGTGAKVAYSPSVAMANQGSGVYSSMLAGVFGSRNGAGLAEAFSSNPDAVTGQLLSIGIKPANGKKFSADELMSRKDEIAKKQALAQKGARDNPFAGIFGGGVAFSGGFWEQGGRGRGGIAVDSAGNAILDAHGNNTYDGWGATQNQYDANGNLTQQGQGGLSTTGAVVGSAQALMAGYAARQANRDNGAGAQDKAAAGSALMAGGATVAMIPGGGWVAGSIMMGVGAILNIMAGADASEHAAKKKDEAFQKQLDELQRTIAIQEEQKKAIGLMAERVLSMRGDVGNTFEGIASSAFLSGRWAGRAIQVQHLTVVANNPTELSQSLTTALTTQSRQGA